MDEMDELQQELFGTPTEEPLQDNQETISDDQLFDEMQNVDYSNAEQASEPSLKIKNEVSTEEDNFTAEALNRIAGIQDMNAIPFIDEAGNYYTRSWDDLDRESKFNILTSANTNPETDLDDSEINLINQIRNSGLDPDTYLHHFVQGGIDNYLNNNQTHDVDSWTDDEVFAIDMLDRIGGENITDEEITEAVNKAKENPDLYQKQVNAIRNQYKQKEQEFEYQKQQKELAQQQEQYQEYENSILNEIDIFNSTSGLGIDLDPQDKDSLASYILEQDQYGQSDFAKDLANPKTRVQSAFWALYGPRIAQEAQQQYLEAYKQGYAKAREEFQPTKQYVEYRQPKQRYNQNQINYFDM